MRPGDGAFTDCGPVEVVREAVFFGGVDEELEEYLEGAYTIGLGIRMSNERQRDGDGIKWVIQLLDDEVSVPASATPRTWALPEGAKLARTWTSKQRDNSAGPVRGALQVAADATDQGRWVRVHTLLHSHYDVDFEGSGTSEFVVDVFDSPSRTAAAPLTPEGMTATKAESPPLFAGVWDQVLRWGGAPWQ